MNNWVTNQKEEINQISWKLSPITKLSTPSRPFSRVKSVTGQKKNHGIGVLYIIKYQIIIY